MNDLRPADSDKVERESIPSTPSALCESGLRLRSAGQPLQATQYCQQALSIDPNHAGALYLMGLLSFDAGQYDHAVEWMARAIHRDPKAGYLNDLGVILQHAKRYEEALKAFDKAVQLKPDSAELWRNLGSVLVQLSRDNEALLSY